VPADQSNAPITNQKTGTAVFTASAVPLHDIKWRLNCQDKKWRVKEMKATYTTEHIRKKFLGTTNHHG